jgi:uncharacterized SAM-binding protein YcdF (DUF218 family)
MEALLSFIFSVRGLLAAVGVGVVWLYARRSSGRPRLWLAGVTLFYALSSTNAVPMAASRWLVAPYHAFTAADAPPAPARVAIVLLAASEDFVPDWDGRLHPVQNRHGIARVAECARVFRMMPDAWVISSGGASPLPGSQPSSVLMRDLLVQAGVPAGRIVLESASETTHDEAVLIAPMLKPLGVDRVVLVTSDVHMRRSMGTFRSAGISAIPAAAHDAYGALPWSSGLVPGGEGLEFAGAVAHEYVGIVGYTIRGWYR